MLFLLVVFSLGFFSATVIALAALWSFYTYQSRHDKLHAAATASVLDRDQILQLFSEDTGGLPSYLRDPDAHHCTWLNTAMEVLWPSIGKAATAWAFKDRNLETLMNSQTFWKPDFLAGSTGIVLQNLELGEKPPQVSAVKIYSSIVSANKSEALIADASFEWSSSMEMTISMKTLEDGGPKSTLDRFVSAVYKTVTIRVVIRDVVARGQLRIIAAPLLSELPVIGTVRASFLGPPTVSYNVSSFGANPLMVPGLETFLQSFISNQVLKPFLYPQGMVVNVAELMGIAVEVPPVRPDGVLSVTILSAANVPQTDLIGYTDPYIKLYVSDKMKVSTTVKANSKNPQWGRGEQFELLVHDIAFQQLTLEMYDRDTISSDELIGRVQLPLNSELLDLSHGNVTELTLPVPRFGKKDKKAAHKKRESEPASIVGSAADMGMDLAKKLGIPAIGSKDCTLTFSVQYFKFTTHDAEATMDNTVPDTDAVAEKMGDDSDAPASELPTTQAAQSFNPEVKRLSSLQAKRVLGGGMLYITLFSASGLASHAGVTKTFKLVVNVGKDATGKPVYSKSAERTGIGKGLDSRNPVFHESLDMLINGEIASAATTYLIVEIWVKHFMLRPSFKGSVSIPLHKVMDSGKTRGVFPLEGGEGTLDMSVEWQGMMDSM